MKTINHIFALFLLHTIIFPVNAQDTDGIRSLEDQYEELKSSSNTYRSETGRAYKVVNEQNLDEFWKSVQDYLAVSREELEATQNKVDVLNQEVGNLTQTIEEQQAIIQESEHAATHISVLGIDIPKDSFEATFWITTAILLVLLAGAIYQFRRSRKVTRRTQMNFMELQEEMEELRKTSLEKERRLRRELQTERNNIEEMGRNSGLKR